MTKAIGPQIYSADFSGKRKGTDAAYKRVSVSESNVQEDWFRDAIYANPELVIDPCRQGGIVPDDEQWVPWATEFSVGAGPVDVLLLASSGRVAIVETKLSYNAQGRREVVAQILDYALALQETEDLPPWPAGLIVHEADVREHIARGELVLIIAGDELDPRALRLGEAMLAGHMTSEWDLAMVDLNIYKGGPSTKPRYVLVPELRGVVAHETRQVVRVVTEGDKTRVKVERLAAPTTASRSTAHVELDDKLQGVSDRGTRTVLQTILKAASLRPPRPAKNTKSLTLVPNHAYCTFDPDGKFAPSMAPKLAPSSATCRIVLRRDGLSRDTLRKAKLAGFVERPSADGSQRYMVFDVPSRIEAAGAAAIGDVLKGVRSRSETI